MHGAFAEGDSELDIPAMSNSDTESFLIEARASLDAFVSATDRVQRAIDALSPDDRLVLTVDSRNLTAWDLATGARLKTFGGGGAHRARRSRRAGLAVTCNAQA